MHFSIFAFLPKNGRRREQSVRICENDIQVVKTYKKSLVCNSHTAKFALWSAPFTSFHAARSRVRHLPRERARTVAALQFSARTEPPAPDPWCDRAAGHAALSPRTMVFRLLHVVSRVGASLLFAAAPRPVVRVPVLCFRVYSAHGHAAVSAWGCWESRCADAHAPGFAWTHGCHFSWKINI